MERRSILVAFGGIIAAACGRSQPESASESEARKAAASSASKSTSPDHKVKSARTTTPTTATSSTTTEAPGSTGLRPVDPSTDPVTTTSSAPTTTTAPHAPGWPAITRAADVPIGGTHAFTFGAGSRHAGAPGILYQQSAGAFVALDTICTHLNVVPCDVSGTLLVCPRHGSTFALSTGAVTNGPATQPLARAVVEVRSDGYVYFVADA